MAKKIPPIPHLFLRRFTVDESAPFRRHLNRLEVEIGGEDYRHLKRVELLPECPEEERFRAMQDITERLLATTQNHYNRELLRREGIRVYLDVHRYAVYYRLPRCALRFTAWWRQEVLHRLFAEEPIADIGWRACPPPMGAFVARFLPDAAGGVLLIKREEDDAGLPLLTATHGPYDPHTLETTFYLLRTGKGRAAVINLGFSGREPLSDENLARLRSWGVPLNPSSIDIIYPYADAGGRPYCYKLEENLRTYVAQMGIAPSPLIIDLHGCVGTRNGDERIIVGLGGAPPYPRRSELGATTTSSGNLRLRPHPPLRQGLALLRDLSPAIHLQFCSGPRHGYLFQLSGDLQLTGRRIDLSAEVASLLPGEERNWLPAEDIRWLPGAGGNALQRREARRMRPDALCLHVEIPTQVRRRIALCLRRLDGQEGF
ncbi:MAG: hypothetical protein WDA20_03270 [Desulfuromonadales bacterium]